MSREIKFRGYCERDSEWRYGFYVTDGENHEILTRLSNGTMYGSAIDPETLGEYTGLKDKEGKEVYEGDIIHLVKNRFGEGRHEVWSVEYGYFGDPHKLYVCNHINSGREIEYDLDELYYINPEGVMTPIPYFSKTGEDKTELRVIGNIHKNLELLDPTASEVTNDKPTD